MPEPTQRPKPVMEIIVLVLVVLIVAIVLLTVTNRVQDQPQVPGRPSIRLEKK